MANNIQCFAKAKLEQFKSIVNSPEAKKMGVVKALTQANYRIEQKGNTLHCQKGHAIVSFDGHMADAMVTIIRSENLKSCQ